MNKTNVGVGILHLAPQITTVFPPDTIVGCVRIWDSGTYWPTAGSGDDSRLRSYCNVLEAHGNFDKLLCVGIRGVHTYTRAQVEAVAHNIANNYVGRISTVEFINEPNTPILSATPQMVAQMCAWAYPILHAAGIKVAGPAPQSFSGGPSYMEAFIQAGGAQFVDILSCHCYAVNFGNSPDPTVFANKYTALRAKYNLQAKPLWDTEFNILNSGSGTVTGAAAKAFVKKWYGAFYNAGFQRSYWYAWDTRKLDGDCAIDLVNDARSALTNEGTLFLQGLSELEGAADPVPPPPSGGGAGQIVPDTTLATLQAESTATDLTFTSLNITGTLIQWTVSGTEANYDHYNVYLSLDGQNFMFLASVTTKYYDFASWHFAQENYVTRILAVGTNPALDVLSPESNFQLTTPQGGSTGTGANPYIKPGDGAAFLAANNALVKEPIFVVELGGGDVTGVSGDIPPTPFPVPSGYILADPAEAPDNLTTAAPDSYTIGPSGVPYLITWDSGFVDIFNTLDNSLVAHYDGGPFTGVPVIDTDGMAYIMGGAELGHVYKFNCATGALVAILGPFDIHATILGDLKILNHPAFGKYLIMVDGTSLQAMNLATAALTNTITTAGAFSPGNFSDYDTADPAGFIWATSVRGATYSWISKFQLTSPTALAKVSDTQLNPTDIVEARFLLYDYLDSTIIVAGIVAGGGNKRLKLNASDLSVLLSTTDIGLLGRNIASDGTFITLDFPTGARRWNAATLTLVASYDFTTFIDTATTYGVVWDPDNGTVWAAAATAAGAGHQVRRYVASAIPAPPPPTPAQGTAIDVVFSNHPLVIPGHTVLPWIVEGGIADLSITVSDLDGGSDQGELQFTVQDRLRQITASFPSTVYEGARAVLKTGFPGMAYEDYVTLFVGSVDSVANANHNLEYTFTCVDNRTVLNKVIFTKADDGSPTDSDHHKTLNGHPLNLLLAIFQNELGIDPSDIDVAKIQRYRDGIFSGIQFTFEIDSPPAAKDFIEQQLMKPLGGYIWYDHIGRITVNFFYPEDVAPVLTIDTDMMISPTPEAEQADLVNTLSARFDKNTDGKFLAEAIENYQPSIAKYGLFGQVIIESDGMRSGFQGFATAALTARLIFIRYALKSLKFDSNAVPCLWKACVLEPGNLVNLSSPFIPDRVVGVLGITDHLFEVLGYSYDFQKAVVTLTLLDVSTLLTFGRYLIAPDSVPKFTFATDAQKARYMFLAGPDNKYSDGTAAHVLG